MQTKVCSKCKKEKDITEFCKDKSRKDGLSYWCRECRIEYHRRFRQNNRKIINKIKLHSGCQICGYNKCVEALVFHHKNPEEKKLWIGHHSRVSKKRLLNEISKCVVLCENCHRELHWKKKKGVDVDG